MAKGMLHFTKAGSTYKGDVHKMPDGSIHSGKNHTKSSKKVYHFKDLPVQSKNKAGQEMSLKLGKK
jgi:hypothetical protein